MDFRSLTNYIARSLLEPADSDLSYTLDHDEPVKERVTTLPRDIPYGNALWLWWNKIGWSKSPVGGPLVLRPGVVGWWSR